MSNNRYVVQAGKHQGVVQISEDGARAGLSFEGQKAEAESGRLGSAFWSAMKTAGANPQAINMFTVHEEGEDGRLVATVTAVLEGAHATWLILYRADKHSSAFRSIGSRWKIGDALDATFEKLASEIRMPHKP